MNSVDDEIAGGSVISHDERPDHVFAAVCCDFPGSGSDSALQPEADHSCSRSDGALLKIIGSAVQCLPDMLLPDMKSPDIVESPVVTFCNKAVYGSGGYADIFILFQHIFRESGKRSSDAESVGHHDGSFNRSQFLNLHQSDAFAEPVEDGAAGHDFVPENVAAVRKNGGYAGVDLPVLQSHLTDPDALHVCDFVSVSPLELPVKPDGGVRWNAHKKSSLLMIIFCLQVVCQCLVTILSQQDVCHKSDS